MARSSKEPIKLPNGQTIIDIDKFLASHRAFVASYGCDAKKKLLRSYCERLRYVENLLKNEKRKL